MSESKVFIYEKDMQAEVDFLRAHIEVLQLHLEIANLTTERTIQLAESFKSMLADMHEKHSVLVGYLLEVYGLEWVAE